MVEAVGSVDPWLRALLFIAAATALAATALALNWLTATRRTDFNLLRAGPVRRRWRWYRSLWIRAACNATGWPHIINRILGTHRARVAPTRGEPVWTEGTATLYRYARSTATGPPLLVVHALVSKPWILDLATGDSLIEFLLGEGFDVFLLDWGDPGATEATRGFSAYADTLMRAEAEVLARSRAPRLHLIGYCLGGTLCLARAAARRHDHLGSITLLAAPIDFAVPAGLQPFISHPLFKPVYLLDGSACVPAPAVREAFHALRPQAIRTVLAAWRRRRDPEFRRVYDPLARWVWEHRRLPGQLFFDLVDLFRSNRLVAGTLVVAGEVARLSDVKAPVLAVIAERDHITPSGSSHALTTHPEIDVTVLNVASGHVSTLSGSTARSMTWEAVGDWVEKHHGNPDAG